MKSKQDGTRLPDYVVGTRDDMRSIGESRGVGGMGLHEPIDDARRRGIKKETPPMAKRRNPTQRKLEDPSGSGDDAYREAI